MAAQNYQGIASAQAGVANAQTQVDIANKAIADFSYIEEIDTASDWTYLGFRMAVVPD